MFLDRQSIRPDSRKPTCPGRPRAEVWLARSTALARAVAAKLVELRRPVRFAPLRVGLNGGRYSEFHGRRPGWLLAAASLLMLDLLPLNAAAQITEPLLPVPPPPSAPQAPAAPGQPIYPGQTVTERARPEFDPIGGRTGDFFWFPRAELGEQYNDNIFATPSPTTDDLITVIQPRLDLLSSFPRNALNLHVAGAFEEYLAHPSQNTQDGIAAVDGRLDVTARSFFYGSGVLAHLHYPRTSPDSPGNAAKPVTYNSFTATAGFIENRFRVGYQAEVAVSGQRFNAVPLIGGGTLPESGNDLNIYQVALRGYYEFVPDYQGYLRFSENVRSYQNRLAGAVSFDSQGHRADLGLQILPGSRLIYGEFYVGYLSQEFNASSLATISGPDVGGKLVWNVTRLSTITFNGLRAVNQSNPSVGTTGTGYLASTVSATIDHELRRNVLLNASLGYENDAFSGISRTDNTFSVGVGAKYLLNRNLYLGGFYNYQQRSSSGTVATTRYTQNSVLLRLSTQF